MSEVVEDIKHELACIDRTGDTKTIWDPRNADEVDVAKDTFKKLRGKGYLIYSVDKEGGKGKAMSDFDPKAAKMIAVPPIVGG